ncbi:MAG: hypothetical protein ACHP7O_10290 [Burkholderiales bacterium]
MAMVQVDPEVLLTLIRGYASKTATATYLETLRESATKRGFPPAPTEVAAKSSTAEYLQAIEAALCTTT